MITKFKKLFLSIILAIIALFIIPTTFNIYSTNAVSLHILNTRISVTSKTLYVGYGCKLNIVGTNSKAKWYSSNPKIATVDSNGYVKAKSKGTAYIKAIVNGKTCTCLVKVNKNAVVYNNATRELAFDGTFKKVTYKSSNSKIASINKYGKITVKKVGTVNITAKVGNKTYSCILKVKPSGWHTDSKGNIYYYTKDKKVKGWKYIGKYKYYFDKKTGILDQNVANKLKGKQSYYIHINRKQCKIVIFAKDGKKGYTIPVIAMTCSVGRTGHETPTGTYYTKRKARWMLLMGPSYGQYCTKVVGGIYFHSVPGSKKSIYNVSAYTYNQLGRPASHGCIRLCVRDSKWIYDHCKIGTKVTINDKSDGCKFKKPVMPKLDASQNYDPTDPAIKKK